jgi:putative thioredoxin
MPANSSWIVNTSETGFERDVIERSREVPVVVDFWATWCQPCRLLGPMLEKIAEESQGKFVLVKAQTEEMPAISAAFGVQAIPTVVALRDGRIVDQFVGLLPEPQLRAWINGILPTPAEVLAADAKALEAADPRAAEAKYRQVLDMKPNDTEAQVGLARVLLATGRLEESRNTLDELAELGTLDPEGQRVHAKAIVALEGRQAGSVAECRAVVAANPDDLALRLRLAKALAAAGQYEEAMEICVALVQKDRRGQSEAARELMVRLFHLLGSESELAAAYRRKLAMALY